MMLTATKECRINKPARDTLSFSRMEELLASPFGREAFSPFTAQPWLLADLATFTPAISPARLQQVVTWLQQLPCPTIALASTQDGLPSQLLKAFDVVVGSLEEASSLTRNIRQYPITAMTLVQLLRLTEGLDIWQGLLAESLAYATLQGSAETRDFLATRAGAATPPADAAPAVLVDRDGSRLTITLNRPDHRNAFSIRMRDGLIEALQLLALDNSIDKAIIRGAGACFCSGGDLTEFGTAPDPATAHAVRSSHNAGLLLNQLAGRIECHVHRACIGSGIELPAFCHRIIATPNTFFQLPEITMGLIPGAGGTVSITRRIGRQRMGWLTLSAKRINAATALEWGLIDAIAP